jgi:di/tricarboxylate transporter
MDFYSITTLIVILLAVALFVTEILSIDLVAILIIVALVLTGIISPEEGVEGFGNTATITVAFMFVISAAMLKTGALQFLAHRLSKIFKRNFKQGMLLMMVLIAFISAFINNTPVVAVFIPVIIQVAKASGQNPKKMLIPLSFASIFGGTCTLVGTSTNMLVSGIAEKEGLEPISMFQLTPIGLIFFVVGILYMLFIGDRLLPEEEEEKDLDEKFNVKQFLTEIQLIEKIADQDEIIQLSKLTELGVDVININREGNSFAVPQDDFDLRAGDVLKIRGDSNQIKNLRDWVDRKEFFTVKMGEATSDSKDSTLVELIIVANSPLIGSSIKDVGFIETYRTVPLGVRQRLGVLNENLGEIRLKAGDIILAETKNKYIAKLHQKETGTHAHFALLSEKAINSFKKKEFIIVTLILFAIVLTASIGILHIMTAAITGVCLLVLFKTLKMKEVYQAIDWQVVFLLAGSLSLGVAMNNTGLDVMFAESVISNLKQWGPIAIVSGLYISTSILTSIISNNAAVALFTPIAIVTANSLGLSPIPFIMAIAFAGSASFMTPIGYQTNTMVYSAGKYKFTDFLKVGTLLNILFWAIATFMIPWVYGF